MSLPTTASLSVLILGSQRVQSLEQCYGRAFQSLGWEVQFWDPTAALHRVTRGQRLGRLFTAFVHVEPWWRKANVELVQLADKMQPTLILIVATEGVRCGSLAQLKVRTPQTLIYCIYPDSPHNLDMERIHCLPFCDRVTTSSPVWCEAFRNLGAARVEYLPFAADTELYHPVLGGADYSNTPSATVVSAHDVVFIGTWRVEREEFLEQLADFDLCVWGSKYWKTFTRRGSPLPRRWGGRPLVGQEFAQACETSKIMLNIMDPTTWPGPNMRVFEQAACGAFSLVTRSPAVTEIFEEGRTIECFDSVEEARDKIRFYLQHEDARQKIAHASYEFVTRHGHTYEDRAQRLNDWLHQDQTGQTRESSIPVVQTRIGEEHS